MTVQSIYTWGGVTSPRWPNFHLLAGVVFLAGIFTFIYGGLNGSQIWMVTPLVGLIFLPVSLLARTWGWVLAFSLLVIIFPLALVLQGI